MAIGPNGSRFVENLINDLENSFDQMIRDSYIRKNIPVTFTVGCTVPDEEILLVLKDHIEYSYVSAGWTTATLVCENNNCILTLEIVEGVTETEPNNEEGTSGDIPVEDEPIAGDPVEDGIDNNDLV